jgi:hypothetical protein
MNAKTSENYGNVEFQVSIITLDLGGVFKLGDMATCQGQSVDNMHYLPVQRGDISVDEVIDCQKKQLEAERKVAA